jgi:hypothetical protein
MTTTRTCATCAHFNPVRPIKQPGCWNEVTVDTGDDEYRWPGPTDVCGAHQTHKEDAEETAFIDANRAAIWDGIKAQVATQELLGKLRKDGAH